MTDRLNHLDFRDSWTPTTGVMSHVLPKPPAAAAEPVAILEKEQPVDSVTTAIDQFRLAALQFTVQHDGQVSTAQQYLAFLRGEIDKPAAPEAAAETTGDQGSASDPAPAPAADTAAANPQADSTATP